MIDKCACIHLQANELERHSFPFDVLKIPLNGIYFLFEKGETSHGQDRIVRVGTHTGDKRLRPRLKEHFIKENKDRSIFRKNIGRAFLNEHNDPFLKCWDLKLTTRKARAEHSTQIDFDYQNRLEKKISQYIRDNFSFSVLEVQNKEDRLEFESKLISTISWCEDCKPSDNWLGNKSPKEKIVRSGLWLVNELYKTPFDADGMERFKSLAKN